MVPSATFGLLYGFVILLHDRRRVIHLNMTSRPTAQWVVQQLRQAFPFDTAPRYLMRDRDAIYGEEVCHALQSMGIEEVLIAPRSPWQNPYCERLIGTIRRDCLDHAIVLNERHLMRLLRSCFNDYHTARSHQALDGNAPKPRAVEPETQGKVVAIPMDGGLHHRYRRSG